MVKTFVEIGAAGFDTCLPLAKAGWKGISIEPVPYLFERTKKQNHVDFLKIDAEGHELNILMGYSFILKPRFIKIEHKHVDDILLCSKLKENGYLVWTEKDDIYGLI